MTENHKKHTEKETNQELKVLQEQLQKAQEEIAKLHDQFLRAHAEIENTKRRSDREIAETRKYAVSTLVKDLINVAESLHHATDHITEEHKKLEPVVKIIEGIELTKKELMSVLAKNLVRRIMPVPGEPFDHNYHEAISQIADDALPKNSIVKVIQAGYIIDDRLIKPALVLVSSGAQK